MPEGHTLHRLAGQLHPLVGRRLSASSPQGRFADGAGVIDRRRRETCGRCGTPVSSWALGPRTAYACETCQPR